MTVARVSQVVTEVLRDGSPAARVSQVVTEVLRDGAPKARVSQVVVEVLYPSASPAPSPSANLAAWHDAIHPGGASGTKSVIMPTSHPWAFVLLSLPGV